MKILRIIIIMSILCSLYLSSLAQEASIKDESAFNFNTSYIGDAVGNLQGGIETGTAYLGFANIGLGFNTKKANWWNGGQFAISFGSTHGDEPSADLIGDIQTASNIEAGNLTFLYECWFKQKLQNLDITLGIQDVNTNYAVTANGGLFLNNSFGLHTAMSLYIPIPTYPTTALGANIQWNIADDYIWQIAFFDGTPNSKNAYNTNLIIGKEDGYLIASEFQLEKNIVKNNKGYYKIGGYYHQHNFAESPHENSGLYIIADQNISKKIAIFSQIGLSLMRNNNKNDFFSLGLNFKDFSNKRVNDEIGFAVANLGVYSNDIKYETTIELTYKLIINNNLYLQPDIQYIINPAKTGVELDNALVGIIRFGFEL